MAIVRVVQKPDNSVAIIEFAIKSKRTREEEFTRAMLPKYNDLGQQINPLVGLPYEDIDSSNLPQSKEYRNAWEFDVAEKKVKINSAKKDAIDAEKAEKEADKQALADLIKDKKDGKI